MIQDFKEFNLFGKRTFAKAIIRPPFKFAAEMPNEACFYYIVSGHSHLYTATDRFSLKATEGIVMQCGNYLSHLLSNEGNKEYCEAIAIHFHPEVLKTIYDREFPDFIFNVNKMQPARYDKVRASRVMKNYIENLKFYFDNPELVSEELLKLKLKEIILLLAKTDNAAAIRDLLSRLFNKADIDFKQVIEANIYNNLSLDELALLCNMSLSTFKREFDKNYDSSPAKYIRKRKLAKAAELLKNTNNRISDVAYDCGFSDLSHFSKSFQKAYQLSPTDYRLNQNAK